MLCYRQIDIKNACYDMNANFFTNNDHVDFVW